MDATLVIAGPELDDWLESTRDHERAGVCEPRDKERIDGDSAWRDKERIDGDSAWVPRLSTRTGESDSVRSCPSSSEKARSIASHPSPALCPYRLKSRLHTAYPPRLG